MQKAKIAICKRCRGELIKNWLENFIIKSYLAGI
jgi:hypothetical protein